MATFTLLAQDVVGDPFTSGNPIDIATSSTTNLTFYDLDDDLGAALPGETVSVDGGPAQNYEFLGTGNVRGDPLQKASFIRLDDGTTFAIDLNADGDGIPNLQNGNTKLTVEDLDPNDPNDQPDFPVPPDPVCYVPGTLILTECGERPVQDLQVGECLVTADRGLRPMRWIGRTEHRFEPGPHKHKPIEIKAGSLGDGLPQRTLIVSPQHHMLFEGAVAEELFGTREVLALAKALVGLDQVRAMNGKREVIYYSLLCDQHEVIMAEGAWSETLYPGPTALKLIGPRLRREVEALFPALRTYPRTGYGPKARLSLTRKETEALVDKLLVRGFGRKDDEIAKWKREAGFREWDRELANDKAATRKQSDHMRQAV